MLSTPIVGATMCVLLDKDDRIVDFPTDLSPINTHRIVAILE